MSKYMFPLFLSCLVYGLLSGCSGGSGGDPAPVDPAPLQLNSPVRLTTASTGQLWVVDHLGDRVFQLDQDGLGVIDSFPTAASPAGVVKFKSRLLVAAQGPGSVSVYSLGGDLLYQLGQGAGEFRRPNGLAVNVAAALIYVVDLKAAHVRVFSTDGVDTGLVVGALDLNAPTAITYDAVRDEILVSDFGVPDVPGVRVYASDGTLLRVLAGTTGGGMLGGTTIFSAPQGLVTDGLGHLFLVDSLLGQVLILDQVTGALLGTLGQAGTGSNELFLPLDVALDSASGDVFVANNQLSRVDVFRQGGCCHESIRDHRLAGHNDFFVLASGGTGSDCGSPELQWL